MAEQSIKFAPIEERIEGYDPASPDAHAAHDEYNQWIADETVAALEKADGGVVQVIYSDGSHDRLRLNAFGEPEPLDDTP